MSDRDELAKMLRRRAAAVKSAEMTAQDLAGGGQPPSAPGGPQVDPATGQPVQIDPATGQPMAAAPAQQIDPATGQPVQIDPATGQPMAPPEQQAPPSLDELIKQGDPYAQIMSEMMQQVQQLQQMTKTIAETVIDTAQAVEGVKEVMAQYADNAGMTVPASKVLQAATDGATRAREVAKVTEQAAKKSGLITFDDLDQYDDSPPLIDDDDPDDDFVPSQAMPLGGGLSITPPEPDGLKFGSVGLPGERGERQRTGLVAASPRARVLAAGLAAHRKLMKGS